MCMPLVGSQYQRFLSYFWISRSNRRALPSSTIARRSSSSLGGPHTLLQNCCQNHSNQQKVNKPKTSKCMSLINTPLKTKQNAIQENNTKIEQQYFVQNRIQKCKRRKITNLISSTSYKVYFVCCKACHCNGFHTMWWIQASPEST